MSTTTTKDNKNPPNILLNKYELGRLLGRGTFAKVYHARSISDNASVAIKVLSKPEITKTSLSSLILNEISAMHQLSRHPNILQLHEVMATKSKIYLIMEHAKGGELFSLLTRQGKLKEPVARRYFQQLVSALRFCHGHGVSHRDVKPENLLLDRDGNLKLSDFGLSALPDQQRGDGLLHTACGTPAYTAPEVIRRKGYDGAKADAWSCGVILYVLLAGFLPFSDSNLVTMYKKIHKRDYQFPPWFSSSAKQVIYKLLDPNPATRIAIGGVMELSWLRRAYSLDSNLDVLAYVPPKEGSQFDLAPTCSMNAFDIISLSSGLDLSGLFEDGKRRKERRFTSQSSIEEIIQKIEEVSPKFGYIIEKKKGGAVGRGKWGSVLNVEVSEVAAPMVLVEVKVDGCNGKDNEGISWGDLEKELGEIVFDWHKNEVI